MLDTDIDADHGLGEMRVVSMTWQTERVCSLTLARPDGEVLPEIVPGAHIELLLKPGLRRAYSVIRRTGDRRAYELGVLNVVDGKGGSRHIHTALRVGDVLVAGRPVSLFPLDENAEQTIFFAGGIGITPFFSMMERLDRCGRPWRLVYCARSARDAAFADRLPQDDRVQLHHDELHGVLDLAAILRDAAPGTHVYCCGPKGMLDAFVAATAHLPSHVVHLESFSPKTVETHAGFTLELARSGIELPVGADESILDAMLAAGLDAPYSCQQGICGACELTVLEGIPDHRDEVLTPAERAANRKIITCCSSSRSDRLKLDF